MSSAAFVVLDPSETRDLAPSIGMFGVETGYTSSTLSMRLTCLNLPNRPFCPISAQQPNTMLLQPLLYHRKIPWGPCMAYPLPVFYPTPYQTPHASYAQVSGREMVVSSFRGLTSSVTMHQVFHELGAAFRQYCCSECRHPGCYTLSLNLRVRWESSGTRRCQFRWDATHVRRRVHTATIGDGFQYGW